MRRALLAGIVMAALPAAALAGPWPMGEGGYYAKFGFGWLTTDDLATPDGRVVEIPEFERQEASLYLEYGLSARWTAIARLPVWSESEIDGFGSAYGPGDAAIGLQRQLPSRGPWVAAVRGSIQGPTGDEELGKGLLPTGTGAWEAELLLSGGRSLAGGRGWTYLEAGYRARGRGLTDAVVYRTQVGLRAGKRLRLSGNLHGVEPEGQADPESGVAAGLGNGVRYLAFGPEVAIDLANGWSLELGGEDTTQARNLATGITIRLGVARRR